MTKVTRGLMHHGVRKPKYLTEGPPWGIAEATCNCGLENIDTPVFWGQKCLFVMFGTCFWLQFFQLQMFTTNCQPYKWAVMTLIYFPRSCRSVPSDAVWSQVKMCNFKSLSLVVFSYTVVGEHCIFLSGITAGLVHILCVVLFLHNIDEVGWNLLMLFLKQISQHG